MKLNRRFSKNSEITEDLDGIAVALCWNGNSESWEKIDCQAGEELRRLLLDFSGRGKKWDIWKDTQADFQKVIWDIRFNDWSFQQETLLQFVEETNRFRSGRNLRSWGFWVPKETVWSWFVKEPHIHE